METMKVYAIMEQLDDYYGNVHRGNTNINYFVPLLESYYEEVTNHKTKYNTPTIVLSEDQEEDQKKGEQNEYNEEDKDDQEKKKTVKIDNPDSDDKLNGGFGIAEFDDKSYYDEEYHIPRSKL